MPRTGVGNTRPNEWRDGWGRVHKIREMSDSYLQNCMNLIFRIDHNRTFDKKLRFMRRELKRRKRLSKGVSL